MALTGSTAQHEDALLNCGQSRGAVADEQLGALLGDGSNQPDLEDRAMKSMQIELRPKSASTWHPFQWEAMLHCPTAEGHRVVPFSVSRNGDCLHVCLTGRTNLIRLFQRRLFRQANPVTGDVVRFLYTLLSTPPCERRYA